MTKYVTLPRSRKEVEVLGRQLLRSGTSVAAHISPGSFQVSGFKLLICFMPPQSLVDPGAVVGARTRVPGP